MRMTPLAFAMLLSAAPAYALNGSTSPLAAPDLTGGIYRLISDSRGLWVWHQRGDGTPALGYATAQLVDSAHNPTYGTISADGFGGALISYRAVYDDSVVEARAMRVQGDIAPAPGWSLHGNLAAATPVGPGFHGLASDLAGGMYTAWQDFRTDYNDQDIVMQRMASSGQLASGWPVDGLFVCDAPGDQYDPVLVSDPAGGAYAAWWDGRAIGTAVDSGLDIWAQRIGAGTTMEWAHQGVPVTRRAGEQSDPTIILDGQGGALVAWVELPTPYPGAGHGRIGIQRLGPTGSIAIGWPPDGYLLGMAGRTAPAGLQPTLATDGQGGAYALWADTEAGNASGNAWTVQLQHVLSTGANRIGHPTGRLTLAENHRFLPVGPITDGQGGVIAAWLEELDAYEGTQRLWVQRVRFDDTIAPGWPRRGIVVAEGSFSDAVMVSDNAGGATLSWVPSTASPGTIPPPAVRRVTHEGVVDPYWGGYPDADGQPVATPTPSPGPVTITFALPVLSSVEARVFDLSGRRVRELGRIAESPAGRRTLSWDGRDDAGDALPAGLYFVRLRWGQRDHTTRVVIAR